MERSSDILKNLDWLSIFIYAVLVIFGWINIYAAVYNEEHKSILDISQQYGKQLLWISVSVILIIVILVIDSRIYEMIAYPIYAFAVFLLLLVLLFGREFNGARSWFVIGGFMFQPAEFTKVATSLALAKFMSEYSYDITKTKYLLITVIVITVPMMMIILQNDTGSALVYGAFIIVLFREGLSPVLLFIGLAFVALFISVLLFGLLVSFIAVGVVLMLTVVLLYNKKTINTVTFIYTSLTALLLYFSFTFTKINPTNIVIASIIVYTALLTYPYIKYRLKNFRFLVITIVAAIGFTLSVEYIFNNILEKHQRTRINVVLGIESDPRGVGYNVNQSKIAIGSGGVSGKGFLQGTQTKFDFVPEQETDFIFCTVGEEWGFVGSSFVIVAFAVLLIRLIMLADRQRRTMYRIYGYAVVAIIFFHITVNIGMTIGLAPVIGIPLPFFSYGGSSLWSFTILLFIFLRLDASRMDKL